MPTCQGIWNGAQTASHVFAQEVCKVSSWKSPKQWCLHFSNCYCFYNCWHSINPTAKVRLDWQDANKPTNNNVSIVFKKCMNLQYVFSSVDPSCIPPCKYVFSIIILFMAFGNATRFGRSSCLLPALNQLHPTSAPSSTGYPLWLWMNLN
jgi:hypothetical protein